MSFEEGCLGASRVGRKRALDAWQRQGLDAIAQQLIDDVQRRAKEDGRWLNGFVPDPVTYLEEERWTDELQPRRATKDPAPPSAPPPEPSNAAREKLASRIAWLRQQHRYGEFGEGQDADDKLDAEIAAARAELEPQSEAAAA